MEPERQQKLNRVSVIYSNQLCLDGKHARTLCLFSRSLTAAEVGAASALARTRFTFCVAPECQSSRSGAVSRTTQLLPGPTSSSPLFCLLLSALLFSFWASKPAFIWMMESLVTPGVTARGSRRRVAASFVLMFPQVWSTSCVFVCLFLFLLLTVCCTLIGKSHMWKKAWRDRIWPSRRHSCLWDFHL